MKGNIRFISAGAGSGKTYELTRILSERLAAGAVRPEAVIATTFTVKAANELVERVRQRLIGDGRHSHANSMGQALIGTVNSVCGQLLQRYAFEAGLSPDLDVLAEQEQALLFAHALEDAMDIASMRRMNALAARLEQEEWDKTVLKLVDSARANNIDASDLADHGARSLASLLALLPPPVDDPGAMDFGQALATAVGEIEGNGDTTKGTRDYLQLVRAIHYRLQNGAVPWGDWLRICNKSPTKRSAEAAERLKDVVRRFDRHPGFRQDIIDWTEALYDLAARSLTNYQQFKKERGLMDFVDQEHRLLRLLDQPAVAESIREELDLLLVDEFQDTSPIQLALFLKLAELAGECIWVGDVKQAIYGFRGSDPELMKAVLQGLKAADAPVDVLEYSWRARPALVSLTNALFVPAFADDLEPEEVRLAPQRDELSDEPALRTWHVGGSNADKRGAALAAGVGRLLDGGHRVVDKASGERRPIRPRDIAILCRQHSHARTFAQALTAAGLDVAMEQPGLLATPEVHLALACLRRVIDAGDTLASAEIVALKTTAEPERWLESRLDHLGDDGDSRTWGVEGEFVEPALVALEGVRGHQAMLTPSELLDEVLLAADVWRDARAWGPNSGRSAQRLANLETLRGLAVEYEQHCHTLRIAATASGLLLWLHELARQEKDTRSGDGQADAVHVLTHHSAKGLEWPVVIPTGLETEPRGRLWEACVIGAGDRFDLASPLANRHLRYWVWPFGKLAKDIALKQSAEGSEAGIDDARRQRSEEIRLLYVSLTRARDLLVLPLNGKAKSQPWLDTLGADWLDAISDHLQLPDGTTIPAATELLEPPGETVARAPEPAQTGFPPAAPPRDRLPANLSPSSQPPVTGASIGATLELGARLTLRDNPDTEILGNALHSVLAAELICPAHPDRLQTVARAMALHGLGTVLDAAEVEACASRLSHKLTEAFSPTRVLAEWPVTAILDNGQRLNGWIDVLLETQAGWVIVDHKSYPGARAGWADKALSYSGQLDAYRRAVTLATGRPVVGTWIHFSVGGALVEVSLPQTQFQ